MNATMKRYNTLILSILLLAVLLGACANSNKKSTLPASGSGQAAAVVVGMNACNTCHSSVTAQWLTTLHANNPDGNLNSPGNPTIAQIAVGSCASCHDPNGDSGNLTAGFTGNVARPVVGCEACHGPGSLHVSQGGTGPISLLGYATGTTLGPTVVSGQYVLCTSCHALLDSSGTATAAATHDPSSAVTPTGSQYAITDTHFATAFTTTFFGASPITGYAMDYSSETVCTDCHNPHAPADINRDWAQSAHANRSAGAPWSIFNWSNGVNYGMCQRCHTTTGYSTYAAALQAGNLTLAEQIRSGAVTTLITTTAAGWKPEMLECTGCHLDNSGTLRNPGPYTANYGYSITGAAATASFAYPDITSSNVCIPCHSGRQSGDSIKNLVFSNPPVTDFSNLSFIDPHYRSAAGTMYAAIGYTFPRSYANLSTYKHDQIGTTDAPNTGSLGPCAGCHMYRTGQSANHLYLAATIDSNGTITSIVSEVCYQCHAGSNSALAAMADNERIEYEAALAALVDQLDKKGVSFNPSYPYMFQQRTSAGTVSATNGSKIITGIGTQFITAGTTTGSDFFRASAYAVAPPAAGFPAVGSPYGIASVDTETQITLASPYTGPTFTAGAYVIMKGTFANGTTNWLLGGSPEDGYNNMGAAFNLDYLAHEPGAFVHNSRYVKRLIYDSIDWLDDGVLNYSVGATLTALPDATSYKNGAMTYLLPTGVLWQGTYPDGYGIDSERP
jgi:formate-dependent nitrite reductase cytochrome c552 subunit